jgi:hypothetical protein
MADRQLPLCAVRDRDCAVLQYVAKGQQRRSESYSITSSARPSKAVGIVMPSAFSGVFSEQEEEEDCKLHFDFGEFLIE